MAVKPLMILVTPDHWVGDKEAKNGTNGFVSNSRLSMGV